MAGRDVPFRWITGLPHQAQLEIERDFFDVVQQLTTASASEFDAIIDPTLSASDATTHRYKNLTDLLAGESWAAHYMFNVGVVQRGSTAIDDGTTTIDLTTHGDLSLFGVTSFSTDASHFAWKWPGLTATTGQQVFYYNLSMDGAGVNTAVQGGGIPVMSGCRLGSNLTTPFTSNSSTVFDTTSLADLTFSAGSGRPQHRWYSCRVTGSLTIGANTDMAWEGGEIGTSGQSTNLTVSSSGAATIASAIFGNIIVSSNGSSGNPIAIHNVGQQGNSILVTATVPVVNISGEFVNSVTFSNAAAAVRTFRGSCVGLDFTGPGKVDCINGSSATCTLRGISVDAQIASTIKINAVGLTHSYCEAVFQGGSATFDSATHNNIFIFAGTHHAGFTGITDAGAYNRVITEDSDSLFRSLALSGAFSGPPGEDGEDGEQGPPGPEGPKGP